jgi:hypothetical protein
MTEMFKAEIVRPEDRPGERFFVRLSYGNDGGEEFKLIRGAMSWPRCGISGLILIGGIIRGTDTIKVIEETSYEMLPEARKILDAHVAKYSEALYCVYYQNIPESDGFVKHLKGGKQHGKPEIQAAPYTESIDYSIQLVNSTLADNKLKVPGNGILATQLLSGRDNVNNEKELHGVIALSCLISGIEARFDGLFSEDLLEGMADFPPGIQGAD